MTPLRLGTRKSPMAMSQSLRIAQAITDRTGRAVELVGISTYGDASAAQLAQIGGTGVFVTGLRARLLDGQVDLAVHSLKDLPVGPADGIVLAAVPERDDPFDALVARDGAKLADLPAGARIGTGSPRRAAQLLMLRRDLRPVPVRGNAGTRLAKVSDGDLDAVVLAYAGLARIGRLDAVTQVFGPDEMLPAPGQGALAVECRADRKTWLRCWRAWTTRSAGPPPRAERSLLAALQAGCLAPVGAYAAGTDVVRLDGIVVAADGGTALRGSAGGPAAEAERLGRQVAADLLRRGAGRIRPCPVDTSVTGTMSDEPYTRPARRQGPDR